MTFFRSLSFLLFSTCLFSIAYADVIQVELTGTVKSISSNNSFGINPGDPITYAFTFEESYIANQKDAAEKSNTPKAGEIAPVKCGKLGCDDGNANYTDKLHDVSITIGTHSFSGSSSTLKIINNNKDYVTDSGVDVININQLSELNNNDLKITLAMNLELNKDTFNDVSLTESLAQVLIDIQPVQLEFFITEIKEDTPQPGRVVRSSNLATFDTGTIDNIGPSAREQKIDQLFNWAESEFSKFFVPNSTSQNIPGWRYRFYATTQNYVGVNDSEEVYVLGDQFGGLAYVGKLDDLMALIP